MGFNFTSNAFGGQSHFELRLTRTLSALLFISYLIDLMVAHHAQWQCVVWGGSLPSHRTGLRMTTRRCLLRYVSSVAFSVL